MQLLLQRKYWLKYSLKDRSHDFKQSLMNKGFCGFSKLMCDKCLALALEALRELEEVKRLLGLGW